MKRPFLFLLAFSLLPSFPAFARDRERGESHRDLNQSGDIETRQKDDHENEKRLERQQRNEENRRQQEQLRQDRKQQDDQRMEEKHRQDDQRREREQKDEQDRRQQDQLRHDRKQQDDQRLEREQRNEENRRQQDQLRQDRKQQDDQRREDKRQQENLREDRFRSRDRRETTDRTDTAVRNDRENRGLDRNLGQGFRDGGDRRGNDDRNQNGKDRVQGFRDGDKGRNDKFDDRDRKPRLTKRAEELGVRQLPPDMGKDRILRVDRKRSVVNLPSTGPDGQAFKAKTWKNVNQVTVKNHMRTVESTTIINQINIYNTKETKRNEYYWHTDNGLRYCHYNDNWGQHWYGWSIGVNFFWTRYYSNNWWWYDSAYDRWCYWHNGWWWWRDPVNVRVVYIYDNDHYTPATASEEPTVTAPSADNTVVEKAPGVMTYRSKDYTRMVRVVAEGHDAFLYDTAKPPAFRPVFLQTDVKEVRFSDAANGKPLQIMLTLNDGSFELFDAEGNPSGSKDYYPEK